MTITRFEIDRSMAMAWPTMVLACPQQAQAHPEHGREADSFMCSKYQKYGPSMNQLGASRARHGPSMQAQRQHG